MNQEEIKRETLRKNFKDDIEREAPCEICPPGLANKASHVAAIPYKGITVVQQLCKFCIDKIVLHEDLSDVVMFAK